MQKQRHVARLVLLSTSAALAALAALAACTGDDATLQPRAGDPDAALADDAAVDATGADAADAAPPYEYIFVTEGAWRGQEVGGLAGADGKCQAEATAAGFVGRYQAWLNGDNQGFDIRMAAGDGGPWRRADGEIVIDEYFRLHANLNVPVRFTAKGDEVPIDSRFFWTGEGWPDAGVIVESRDCASWTSSDPTLLGTYGDPQVTKYTWVVQGRHTCDQARRLLCLRAEPFSRK